MEIFDIIEEEELTGERNYYEEVKEILNKRYGKNNRCIRGNYSLDNNCCFHTAEETVILFGKSGDNIKKMHKEYIIPLSEKIKDMLTNIKFRY